MTVQEGFVEGLSAAIEQLRKTAEDFEQIGQQLRMTLGRGPKDLEWHQQYQRIQLMDAKAELLRGQITHIEKLK